MTQATGQTNARGRRRLETGEVISNKGDKTITVQVSYTRSHPKYGKVMRQRRRLYAHDEKNEAKVGDWVEIAECRRYSKMKSWRLIRIVEKAPD